MRIVFGFLAFVLSMQSALWAQSKGPGMTFKEDYHDFGDIKQGEVVEYVFEFTNTGDSMLVIQKAYSSCGCTVPSFPKEGIAPGQTGKITVKFNSENKMGLNNKIITILTNINGEVPKRLSIRVNVLPK